MDTNKFEYFVSRLASLNDYRSAGAGGTTDAEGNLVIQNLTFVDANGLDVVVADNVINQQLRDYDFDNDNDYAAFLAARNSEPVNTKYRAVI